MSEQEFDKKIILTHTEKGWDVKFKGEFFSVRDLERVRRALSTKYRTYIRARAVARRKEPSNA